MSRKYLLANDRKESKGIQKVCLWLFCVNFTTKWSVLSQTEGKENKKKDNEKKKG